MEFFPCPKRVQPGRRFDSRCFGVRCARGLNSQALIAFSRGPSVLYSFFKPTTLVFRNLRGYSALNDLLDNSTFNARMKMFFLISIAASLDPDDTSATDKAKLV